MLDPAPIAAFPPPRLVAEDLACARGGRMIFGQLGFTLDPGQCLILTGVNGAGKSSLLRLLAGLVRPASGRLIWQPDDALGPNLHYVGHHDTLKPVLTAWENLDFLARLQGVRPERACLDTFEMGGLADMPGRMLSAGQKRRLALSRLIAVPKPLWLLDEPTTALDRKSIGILQTVIGQHRSQGGMVVLSTHGELDLPGTQTLNLDGFKAKGTLPW